ncbi:hypothetical protein ACRQ5Q_10840 [Bradyrhizobium sp. PMVTL-01]|uniref:hypothetical protein n=1 Tax=Bradyrhizobium sp. PMVTL-01 TaxID=3434999 RepID=UPI003F6FA46B
MLKDDELRQVWGAADQMEYPYRPCISCAASAKAEISEAVWSEFDPRKKLWITLKERMKMDHEHLGPLTEDMLVPVADLPRFNAGPHLFGTTFGERPANSRSKARERIDEITGPAARGLSRPAPHDAD